MDYIYDRETDEQLACKEFLSPVLSDNSKQDPNDADTQDTSIPQFNFNVSLDEVWQKTVSDDTVVAEQYGCSVMTHDLLTLKPNTWVNDVIIDYIGKDLMAECKEVFVGETLLVVVTPLSVGSSCYHLLFSLVVVGFTLNDMPVIRRKFGEFILMSGRPSGMPTVSGDYSSKTTNSSYGKSNSFTYFSLSLPYESSFTPTRFLKFLLPKKSHNHLCVCLFGGCISWLTIFFI